MALSFDQHEANLAQHSGPRRGFDLRPPQRIAILQMLEALLDADEPEALLAVLHRIAESKARAALRLQAEIDEVGRWVRMVEALERLRQGSGP